MNHNEALFTSVFTQCLLAVMLLAIVVRRFWFPVRTTVRGVPVSGVGWIDVPFVILAIAFYVMPAMTALQRTGSHDTGGTANPLYTLIVYLPFILLIYSRYQAICPRPNQRVRELWPNLCYIILPIVIAHIAGIMTTESGLAEWICKTTGAPMEQTSVSILKETSGTSRVIMILIAALVAPFAEEITFRGYLYTFFKCHTGAFFSAVSTSLLFGIMHLSLMHAIPLTVFSLMLIISYEKTRNIWVPIITHVLFNSVALINILKTGAA